MNKIIAIDFDNTLFKTKWPDMWTCRCGKYLDEAVEACRLVGLIFDAVNKNLPESIEEFDGTDSRKVFANEYWDDLAVNSSDLYRHAIDKMLNDI